MGKDVKLSILTPAVPSRLGKLDELCRMVASQVGDWPVEHLVFLDNRRRTVGEKRDALLRVARGEYVAFLDDDDWISPDYVTSILSAVESGPDVVTFLQEATVDDFTATVEFRLGNVNEPFNPIASSVIKRNAWHVCAWRRTLAIQSRFPASNYGEDWAFAAPLCAIPGLKEIHLPQVLHFYRHNALTTEAPPPIT